MNEKRPYTVGFKVSREERAQIRREARSKRLTSSQYLRWLLEDRSRILIEQAQAEEAS